MNDSIHIGSVMMMADPLIHQHGQRASQAPLTLVKQSIDIAESLSFRNKNVWVFESRSQVQFLTINCAALM